MQFVKAKSETKIGKKIKCGKYILKNILQSKEMWKVGLKIFYELKHFCKFKKSFLFLQKLWNKIDSIFEP